MSTSYEDAMYDETITELYKQNIEDYKIERFTDYYLENSNVLCKILDIINLSKKYFGNNEYGPSIIYCYSSIELIFNDIFFKPFLSGSIMDDEISKLVIDNLFNGNSKIDRIKKYLFSFLKSKFDVNLELRIPNHRNVLWKDITDIQKLRNDHIHRGDIIKEESLDFKFYDLPLFIIENIFMNILSKSNLQIDKNNRIRWKY